MTQEEYREEADRLKREYNKRLWDLKVMWAESNSPFNKGDIIQRRQVGDAFIIDKVTIQTNSRGGLDLMYEGRKLTKKLEPMAKSVIIGEPLSCEPILLKKAES
jgi:hypothetical protein